MARTRPAGVVRIACIGDSWTFGMPVGEAETYPRRLAHWLRKAQPDRHYEVLNFGVLGYSSFQGLQLMKSRVLDFAPDVVVIGFGMNDSSVAGYRDRDVLVRGRQASPADRLRATAKTVAQSLETYKLIEYAALALRFRPTPLVTHLERSVEADPSASIDYESLDPWTRVSPDDFESNIREMVRLADAAGARVVLLDNELWENSPYRARLNKLSAELGLPLTDSLAVLRATRSHIENELEERLKLSGRDGGPSASGLERTKVVFRVYRGSAEVPKAMSIVGADPELGSLTPNTVVMRDDGLEGDEKGGDGVWSYAAELSAGARVAYVYTNSGTPGEWQGLDVPYIRRFTVPAALDGRPVHLPIDTFGRVYVQGDHWHPDASGYDAIAREVAGTIAGGY
jgi:lysophospholipase L1-like esterase